MINAPISKQLTTTNATKVTTSTLPCSMVQVWARATNAGTIALGNADGQVGALMAGNMIEMYPNTPDEIYAKASSANDYVDLLVYT